MVKITAISSGLNNLQAHIKQAANTLMVIQSNNTDEKIIKKLSLKCILKLTNELK
jgi:ribosomal protein L7Ae-like RNA K-turn-binding protein